MERRGSHPGRIKRRDRRQRREPTGQGHLPYLRFQVIQEARPTKQRAANYQSPFTFHLSRHATTHDSLRRLKSDS